MTAPASRPAEIRALTGLRAVLAWWVVLYHLAEPDLAAITLGPFDTLRTHGYLAVDGFFILSGFILAYVYRDAFANPAPGTYVQFLIARLSRIYPVHLVVLALLLVLFGSAYLGLGFRARVSERFGLDELLWQVSLLHGWGFSQRLAWNYPSWSISAEWFAYLCFPLVHRLVLRAKGQAVPVAVALAALAGLAVFEQVGPTGNLSYTYEFALIRIGFEFVGGAALLMLARRWLGRAPTHRGRPHALLALLAAGFATHWLPDAAVVACLGLAILFLSHPDDLLARILGRNGAVYAGETSYSVYMVHALIEGLAILGLRAVPGLTTVPAWVIFGVVVVVVQLAADQMWRHVERPGREAGRRAGRLLQARRLAAQRSA